MSRAKCVAYTLLARMEAAPGDRHMPPDDELTVDYRLWAGDVAATYDAMVDAIELLRRLADDFGDAIGDGGARERLRALQTARQQRVCTRD